MGRRGSWPLHTVLISSESDIVHYIVFIIHHRILSRDASEKMNNVINARLRLVQQLGHLSGALSITVAGNEGANGLYNKLNAGFSGCVDTIKIGVENEVR